MLMSPAARDVPSALGEGLREGRKPARAAIEPFPAIPSPPPAPRVPMPGVAELEVVAPSRPVVNPQTGAAAVPSGRFAIDPRTGAVLHETPAGYIDPRTGQVTPR